YEVFIWDLEDSRLARRIGKLPERITSLAWSKAGWLAVAGGSPSQWGTVALVAPGEDVPRRYVCDHPETTLSVAFHPDGKQVVVGSGDRTMRFFETESGKETRVLRQHADWVQHVSFDTAGERVLSGSRDRTAKIVNTQTGEVETTFADHQSAITAATFVSSREILTMDLARRVHLWDSKSGKRRKSWTSGNEAKQELALWDGYAVVAGATTTPELRDLREGDIVRSLAGHRAAVQTLAVSPDGALLATGSLDGEVLIWRAGCEAYLQRIQPAPVVTSQAVTRH
ncbi:MAG: WD40 repeat domain-containing protein, partial [Chthoniobacteraceae bacterium]